MKGTTVLETLSPKDIAALLQRLENRELEGTDYLLLVQLIWVLQTVQRELATNLAKISTLRWLLFGPRPEKQKAETLPEEVNQVNVPAQETVLRTRPGPP